MSIPCDHPRPKLNLPGRTPARIGFNAPTFLPTSSPADMARALLEAFRGISTALQQIGARRTVVPLIESFEAREGQIITGVADGQVIKLPEPVQDGAIGQVTVLLSDVKTPLTVVHPDGTVDTLSEPGIYEFALGSEGEQTWVTPPGAVGGIRAIAAGTTTASTGTIRFNNANNVTFGLIGNTVTASASFPLVSVFAGASSATIGGLSFINGNGVSFGLTTAPGLTLLTASVTPQTQFVLSNSNGLSWGTAGSTVTGSFSTLSFGNANNVTFGLAGSTLTASVTVASTQASIRISGGTTNSLASAFSFANSFNVSFTLNGATLNASATVASTQASINFAAAGVTNLLSNLTFSNAGNVSFGLAGSVLTATVTVASTSDPQIGLVSHIGGNSVSSVTRLVFSNASNVTWDVSTGANAATIRASVAAGGGGGITALALSNAASSVAATGITFNNANGFSFLLSTAAGNAATISGSYTVPTLTSLSFSNANNVTFGIAGSTLTASVTVASSQGSIRISAGTTNNLVSNFSFANGNVSFGLNGSTITASVDPEIGLLSHVGGNSVADATRIAFQNSNNVTFGLSTAAGGATLTASVAAGGAGGVANLIVSNSTLTSASISFFNEPTLTNGAASASLYNVIFDATQSSIIRANALIRVAQGLSTQTGGSQVTKLDFENAGNVSFGLATTNDAHGRVAVITASAPGVCLANSGVTADSGTVILTNRTVLTAGANSASLNNVVFGLTGNTLAATALIRFNDGTNSTETAGAQLTKIHFFPANGISFGVQTTNDANGRMGVVTAQLMATMNWWKNFHIDGDIKTSQSFGAGQFWIQPLDGYGNPWPTQFTLSTFEALLQAGSFSSTQSTAAFSLSYFGALYTLANSTQLSRVNKFTVTIGAAAQAFAARHSGFGGQRWLTAHSSLWDAQPVLSQGVQYWFGWGVSTLGASAITCAVGQQFQQENSFYGQFGVNQGTTQASGFVPFWGVVVAASPPTSIGTANMVTGDSNQRDMLPCLQFRADVARA